MLKQIYVYITTIKRSNVCKYPFALLNRQRDLSSSILLQTQSTCSFTLVSLLSLNWNRNRSIHPDRKERKKRKKRDYYYPWSFMSLCSPHPNPSRTRQSDILRPNISCLSMLMTKVKGSPIFTFSATWCLVGSPLKIFIVHPGMGAVACRNTRETQFIIIRPFFFLPWKNRVDDDAWLGWRVTSAKLENRLAYRPRMV